MWKFVNMEYYKENIWNSDGQQIHQYQQNQQPPFTLTDNQQPSFTLTDNTKRRPRTPGTPGPGLGQEQ